jgi:uncharacterized membrane protein
MSERVLTRTTLVLAIVGLGISGYLSYVHYADIKPFCTGISNCERVQTSDYADVGGLPVALIGLLGYAGILITTLRSTRLFRAAGAYLAYVGVGFSAYLTWAELAEIDAICQWCIASALVMAVLAMLATWRVLRPAE